MGKPMLQVEPTDPHGSIRPSEVAETALTLKKSRRQYLENDDQIGL